MYKTEEIRDSSVDVGQRTSENGYDSTSTLEKERLKTQNSGNRFHTLSTLLMEDGARFAQDYCLTAVLMGFESATSESLILLLHAYTLTALH